MITYRLMVVHWSIFTLSIQLTYCASVYTNIDTSLSSITFCSPEKERNVRGEGRDSSLTFDLYPSPYLSSSSSCKRVLIPPESHGFFIRLVRQPNTPVKSHNMGLSPKRYSSTKSHNSSSQSCPLSIISEKAPLTNAWMIDPCQLELESPLDYETPVRLIQGRLRIIWNHYGHTPASKLVVTVVGKGLPCLQNNKHPCLNFGSEPLLCISKDLVCDGIQNCPSGSEYNSDEDQVLCSNKNTDDAVWEHKTIDAIRKFLSEDGLIPQTQIQQTTLIPSTVPPANSNSINKKIATDVEIRRNSTGRSSLTSDLSRYGPWGYLMLGMLLCGGALLMCGLWECCCRQNKPANNPSSVSVETAGGNSDATATTTPSTGTVAVDPPPPNYDELDPPPPYAILFPNQKASTTASPNENTNCNVDTSQTNNQSN